MKKIYITNGSGTNGKDTFARLMNKYVSTYKYSSINLVKYMLEVAGIKEDEKTEEYRLLCSDMKDRLTKYDDIPFKDITSIVTDFKNNNLSTDILLIDIREPEEIARAVKTFGAETILIRNPDVKKIESNHADRDVENYNYDYVIENNGTLEQLDYITHQFVNQIILQKEKRSSSSFVIYDPLTSKRTTVFVANKILR